MERYGREKGIGLALGVTLAYEMLRKGKGVARKLYLSPLLREERTRKELISLARGIGIPVIENNLKIFKESEKESCYAIGEFLVREEPLPKDEDHVLLESPGTLGNIGTIMRSMASFGVHSLAILLPAGDPHSPKAVRSSMGAYFQTRIRTYPSFEEYGRDFPGRKILPFMLDGATPLRDVDLKGPLTLAFGNEGRGLGKEWKERGSPVLIPMEEGVDSLNLDNAASIALYALHERRRKG